jgi:hypothetical protein
MSTLSHSAVLVKMTRHMFNVRVRSKEGAKIVDQSTGTFGKAKVYKELFENWAKHQAIQSIHTKAYEYHRTYTSPWADEGPRILPNEILDQYAQKVGEFRSDVEYEKNSITEADYNAAIQEDIANLKGLSNVHDYPTLDTYKSRIGIEVTLLPVPDSGDFRVDVTQDVKDQLDKMVNETATLAKNELFGKVEKFVGTIVTNMSKENPRVFESMLTNVADLADTMEILNIHKDADISTVITDMRKLVNGVSTFQLKNSELKRKELVVKAEQLISKMRGEQPTEIISTQDLVVTKEPSLESDII